MNNGTVKFTKVGSDEVIYEMPYASATYAFTRARLNAAKNTSFEGDIDAMANYGVFAIAELDGHKIVDLPPVEKVKPEDVLKACLKIDITVEQPEKDEDGEIDENPTDTKGARS